MKKSNHLIAGFGINDFDVPVCKTKDGVKIWCPIYTKWRTMLTRCYGPQSKNNTYKNCTVCLEWKYFSKFRAWAIRQKGYDCLDLDKDILGCGEFEYSPRNCVFVPAYINRILVDKASARGSYAIGVSVAKKARYVPKPFRADVKVMGESYYLGMFETEIAAHNAWKVGKILSILYALSEYETSEYFDNRVYSALLDKCIGLSYSISCNSIVTKI